MCHFHFFASLARVCLYFRELRHLTILRFCPPGFISCVCFWTGVCSCYCILTLIGRATCDVTFWRVLGVARKLRHFFTQPVFSHSFRKVFLAEKEIKSFLLGSEATEWGKKTYWQVKLNLWLTFDLKMKRKLRNKKKKTLQKEKKERLEL